MRNTDEKREYALGTWLATRQPWGIFVGGAALCTDGKVRKLKRIAMTADTCFSVPASVTVKGKTVAGFIMSETIDGYSTSGYADRSDIVIKFFAVKYRKNHELLPERMSEETCKAYMYQPSQNRSDQK